MLYEQMEEVQGFSRTAKGIANNKLYHLPHGEYRKVVDLLPATSSQTAEGETLQHIHSLAQKAIDVTIEVSKKARKVSYLTASHTTTQIVGVTKISNLTVVEDQ